MSAEQLLQWQHLLGQLEEEARQAEELLASQQEDEIDIDIGSDWDPPADLGPLPAALVERANALWERQESLVIQLGEEVEKNRRHAHVVEAARAASPSAPVYLDQEA